jgi:hypothetical protein
VARQWDGRTKARSDRVVLEFFVSFLFKQKRKELKTAAESTWNHKRSRAEGFIRKIYNPKYNLSVS